MTEGIRRFVDKEERDYIPELVKYQLEKTQVRLRFLEYLITIPTPYKTSGRDSVVGSVLWFGLFSHGLNFAHFHFKTIRGNFKFVHVEFL